MEIQNKSRILLKRRYNKYLDPNLAILSLQHNESFFQAVNVNEEVDGRPLILYAADYGQVDVIDYLISAGADVNVSIYQID